MEIISFKCSGPSGDLIVWLASIKHICDQRGAKADIFMWLDRPAFYYEGAVHPYGNVMFNQYAFDMMKPLVEAHPYVNSFQVWTGQQCIVDLDIHRQRQIGMPYGSIHRWLGYCYPDMMADYTQPWIWTYTPHPVTTGKVIVNRTSRYTNEWINYFFLKEFRHKLVFAGLPDEHKRFQDAWGFELELLVVKDFLELARAIGSARFFLGNQSMCYHIAEAMKVPRILESCAFAPNCIPFGANAYDFRFQEALQFFFHKFVNDYSL